MPFTVHHECDFRKRQCLTLLQSPPSPRASRNSLGGIFDRLILARDLDGELDFVPVYFAFVIHFRFVALKVDGDREGYIVAIDFAVLDLLLTETVA